MGEAVIVFRRGSRDRGGFDGGGWKRKERPVEKIEEHYASVAESERKHGA